MQYPMLKYISIRRIRKKFGLDFKSELAMLLILAEKTIHEALEMATVKKQRLQSSNKEVSHLFYPVTTLDG
jgi:hypothetical protein